MPLVPARRSFRLLVAGKGFALETAVAIALDPIELDPYLRSFFLAQVIAVTGVDRHDFCGFI